MVRGISNLLALLVVIGIVVAVAMATGGIVANILVSQRPKGADLLLTGFM